ncbi:hypothetical protein [Rhodococcoides fascians]|uniref:hypothetical protein n=1 Tax=Rhodococcoides fascians TaxID=1828 RepID=UPI00050C3487|nr:hypothetical protein [Rhodococcus fascians]
MSLTLEQLVEILKDGRGEDIWLLNEDDSTSIVPDQDISEFLHRMSWPKYICRSSTLDGIVSSDGPYAALDYINTLVDATIVNMTPFKLAKLVAKAAWNARKK